MPLIKWTPYLEPFEEFEKIFENFSLGRTSNTSGFQAFVPAVDIYENDNNLVVEMPLPGVEPKDINIYIENDVLTIEGKKEKKTEVDEKNYYRREVKTGSFHRTVALPAQVAGDKAEANFHDGVLKVTVPKIEKKAGKTIKVQIS